MDGVRGPLETKMNSMAENCYASMLTSACPKYPIVQVLARGAGVLAGGKGQCLSEIHLMRTVSG